MYFSWATDLDPKGVNSQIKEAILSPGQGDEDSPGTQSGRFIESNRCLNIFVSIKNMIIYILFFRRYL